jgi:cell division protein FtsB
MMTNYEYTRIDAENKALKKRIEKLKNSIEQIRAEIEQLHHHPKLDFIKNDEVVEMALDIIDHYR